MVYRSSYLSPPKKEIKTLLTQRRNYMTAKALDNLQFFKSVKKGTNFGIDSL